MKFLSVKSFASNALAIAGGLAVGEIYERGNTGETFQVVSAQSYSGVLASSSSLTPDFSNVDVLTVSLGINSTLNLPVNMIIGKRYQIWVTNVATYTLAIAAGYAYPGTAPVLTATVNATDIYELINNGTFTSIVKYASNINTAVVLSTFNINFNITAQSVSSWVDMGYDPGVSATVITLGGGYSVYNPSIINYSSQKFGTINASNTLGATSTNGSIPGTVGNSGWVFMNDNSTGYEAIQYSSAAFIVPAAGTYTLKIWSSLVTDGTKPTQCTWFCNGARGNIQTVTYNGNTTTLLTFTNLTPDTGGHLWVSGNSLSATLTPICLNAIILTRTA